MFYLFHNYVCTVCFVKGNETYILILLKKFDPIFQELFYFSLGGGVVNQLICFEISGCSLS